MTNKWLIVYIYILYTTVVGKILFFLKEVSYTHQGCIYLTKDKVKTVFWNIYIQNNCFLFDYILKYILFLHLQSWVLQFSVSHDP